MTIREAMKIIQEQGVCSLDCMPYNVQRINVPPTPEQRKAATPYRAKSYARLNSVVEMEAYLMTNCFVAGVMVHERFMDAPGGIIPMPEPGCEYLGGHAICIVGFDRRNRIFKFANSWGTQWGDHGFGHIGYTTLQALLMDAWGMVDAPERG
jgi:C1A family cysteine protease